jgi:hypothetical protein
VHSFAESKTGRYGAQLTEPPIPALATELTLMICPPPMCDDTLLTVQTPLKD